MSFFNNLIVSAVQLMPKSVVGFFSKRYIAGESIDDAIRVTRELNRQGIYATIDVLGEAVKNREEAVDSKNKALEVLDTIIKFNLKANLSIKPTQMGLAIDEDFAYDQVRTLVQKAKEINSFVRIDMEDSPCTDMEIDLFRRLKTEFPGSVGLVLQAYLKRTLNDIKGLEYLNSKKYPLNFRLCKGIYIESEKIAFKKYEEINQHFLEDLEYMLKNKIYAGIATHDKPLVDGAYKLIEKYNVPKNMYEFQMLYGVTPRLRESIVGNGHKMRVYVPFGKKWFGYSTRRLKENPKMASHIIKALFVKG